MDCWVLWRPVFPGKDPAQAVALAPHLLCPLSRGPGLLRFSMRFDFRRASEPWWNGLGPASRRSPLTCLRFHVASWLQTLCQARSCRVSSSPSPLAPH